MPESVVIRCPSCQHLLDIPEAFLGRVVTCLECKCPFQAPVRDGDRLTAAVARPKTARIPARIFVALYGLLLLGFAGVLVNGYLFYWFGADPNGAKNFVESNLQFMTANKPDAPKADANRKRSEDDEKRDAEKSKEFQDEQDRKTRDAAATVPVGELRFRRLLFLLMSVGVLLGALAFLLRRFYAMAFVGCFLAAINSPDLGCCFFGAIVGAWGFFALISDEGRKYFGRVGAAKATANP